MQMTMVFLGYLHFLCLDSLQSSQFSVDRTLIICLVRKSISNMDIAFGYG
nr:MAG TPA: hypothetical protein [Caudoviricetes sp.]